MNFFQLLIADKERRDAERMRTIRVTFTEAGMDDFVLDISPLTPIIQLKRELNQGEHYAGDQQRDRTDRRANAYGL
jgi:hypothetical protein